MEFYPYQYHNTAHKYTSHIHNTHKITQLKTNKTKGKKSAHKATQTVKDILQPRTQHRRRKRNKAVPGGLLSCEISRLSHCLDNRYIVGG
jgi:hypothetical protein